MKRVLASLLLLLPAPLVVSGPEDRAAPPAGIGSATCTTVGCHDDLRDAPHAHRPVAEGVCKVCHRPIENAGHAFRIAREGRRLCVACHRELDASPADDAHTRLWPDGCTLCHDPHGTGHPALLTAERVATACEACHAETIAGAGTTHRIAAGLPCTICHDPHGALAVPPVGEGESPCLRCHAATRREIASAVFVHAPAKAGACEYCHVGHDRDGAAGLRAEVPALCLECHDAIRRTVETAKHGHLAAGESGGCMACHTAHASREPHGLRADPLALCHECHDRDVTASDGTTIAAVAAEIERSAYLHGPVRQHDCNACHDVHGSEHARLLVANYTTEFYAPFDLDNFELCLQCHPENGRLSDPWSRLTEFRNGDVNLHYLHVNKPIRGRTCRTCHATHGSDTPGHLRDTVPYGQWQLPVGFAPTDTGGRCQTGCHVERAYDRKNPVAYDAAED